MFVNAPQATVERLAVEHVVHMDPKSQVQIFASANLDGLDHFVTANHVKWGRMGKSVVAKTVVSALKENVCVSPNLLEQPATTNPARAQESTLCVPAKVYVTARVGNAFVTTRIKILVPDVSMKNVQMTVLGTELVTQAQGLATALHAMIAHRHGLVKIAVHRHARMHVITTASVCQAHATAMKDTQVRLAM